MVNFFPFRNKTAVEKYISDGKSSGTVPATVRTLTLFPKLPRLVISEKMP